MEKDQDLIYMEDYTECAHDAKQARIKMLFCSRCKAPVSIIHQDKEHPVIGGSYIVEIKKCNNTSCRHIEKLAFPTH